MMYLDVQGHRNDEGGYDHDAFEIMKHFLLEYLSPFLSEISTPLYRFKNQHQRNDLPDDLQIQDQKSEFEYDVQSLSTRAREKIADTRSTRPTTRAIAEYLGIDDACLICWDKPVERAHVVPESLGGTNDIRNFALLCTRHHRESPDIADAEGFWAWIDYVHDRESGKLSRMAAMIGADDEFIEQLRVARIPGESRHFTRVKQELIELYQWKESEFESIYRWDALMDEYHHVIDTATSTHFAIKKKASTDAWAFDIARKRLINAGHRSHKGDKDIL